MASTFMLVCLPDKSVNSSWARHGLISSAPSESSTFRIQHSIWITEHSRNAYWTQRCRDPAMIQRTWCEVAEKEKDRFYLHEQVGNWKCENLTDLSNYGVPSAALLSHMGSQPLTLARGVSSVFLPWPLVSKDHTISSKVEDASFPQHPKKPEWRRTQDFKPHQKKHHWPNKPVSCKTLAGDILEGEVGRYNYGAEG